MIISFIFTVHAVGYSYMSVCVCCEILCVCMYDESHPVTRKFKASVYLESSPK